MEIAAHCLSSLLVLTTSGGTCSLLDFEVNKIESVQSAVVGGASSWFMGSFKPRASSW
jgi:hypothetical protein